MRHRRAHVVRLAVLAAVLALAACKDKNTPTLATQRSVLPDSADQVMFGLRHALTTDGIRRGEMHADTAFFYDQSTRIEMQKVNTIFFDAAGAKNATITSKRGTFSTRTKRVEGWGDVVVTSTDGRRLTSPHLVYDQTLNQISSDTTFTFTAPGRVVSGIGFHSDPQLHNVQVLKNAHGSTVLPAGGAKGGAKP